MIYLYILIMVLALFLGDYSRRRHAREASEWTAWLREFRLDNQNHILHPEHPRRSIEELARRNKIHHDVNYRWVVWGLISLVMWLTAAFLLVIPLIKGI